MTTFAVSRLGDDAPLVSAASGSKGTVSKPTHVAQEDTTKNKTKKDPNMPRQGRTTYNFFMEANRGRVIAENPNAKDYKEIVRLQAIYLMCLRAIIVENTLTLYISPSFSFIATKADRGIPKLVQ